VNINDAQSKLVKDILGRQAEQEAVQNAGAKEEVNEEKDGDSKKETGGIRLGGLRKTGS
jgi:hypothetical protein